ncbi:MAG: hypothetical protein AAB624_01930 [Patescibacteria group bacterium]
MDGTQPAQDPVVMPDDGTTPVVPPMTPPATDDGGMGGDAPASAPVVTPPVDGDAPVMGAPAAPVEGEVKPEDDAPVAM